MGALLAAVRRACSPAIWSRGVELSRAGAVLTERTSPEEVELRVAVAGGGTSPAVVLYPQDNEWSCECASRDDACVHVAAAVIALSQARQGGQTLPAARPDVARLGYRFGRTADGLALERVLMDGKGERRLEVPLSTLARRDAGQATFVATRQDTAVELLLGGRAQGLLSRVTLQKVLAALVDCPEVRLDGKPVQVGEAQPVMRGRLEARAAGWHLSLVQDRSITAVFANGAVLCGNMLRPVGDLSVSTSEVESLRRGRLFRPEEVADLLTHQLPNLKARIPVDVVGGTLPSMVREAPRLVVDTSREGDGLSVLATLVYGDPPRARVDAGQLRQLSDSIVVRDPSAEARLQRQLQAELTLQVGHRVVVAGAQAIDMAERLRRFGGVVQGSAYRDFFVAPTLQPNFALGATPEAPFDLSFETTWQGERRRVDAAAVLQAWQRGEAYVSLLEGGFAPLPVGWLERFGHRVIDLLLARDASGALPSAAKLDLARLCDDLEHPKPPELAALQAGLADFTGIAAATLPTDLTASLRPYQRQGVDWLVFLREHQLGAMLADDMGLGKTLQALCAVQGRTLVVAPTSVLHNWADEAARFRPGLRTSLYHGPHRRLDPQADLTFTSYALLRLDGEALAAISWDTVVLDEAQAIKNPDSQVARAAFSLRARFRLTLTGTPVENRLDELWSQFHFANRGLLGGRSDFDDRYAKPVAAGEPGAAARLRERIRPFMLRRLKAKVAPDLPPRTDGVLRCTLSPPERAVYDAVRAATMADVMQRLQQGQSVMAVLEALLRLRQACCHAALVPGQTVPTSAKVELLVENLDEIVAEGHKALVFSQWTGLLDLVEVPLKARNIPFNRLDGSTADRAGVVRTFQADDGPPVMLVSLKAGGTGLNLTAADHVFLLDPWWNPAVEDQAADRAHRIGQTRPVFVHRLIAEDTLEERILSLQEGKRAVAQAALEGAERGAALTRDDLISLLQ